MMGKPMIFAYEKVSHKKMNEFVSKCDINGFNMDTYLKNNVGFSKGMSESIAESLYYYQWLGIILKKKANPMKCISDGGSDEDSPPIRCMNHFHDPLKEWDKAGLSIGSISGDSSILWVQKTAGSQYLGNYSWHDARGYFYRAMTSCNEEERSLNYVQLFNGLGHIMHLVQDSAVPEHVRNDEHTFSSTTFEKNVLKKKLDEKNMSNTMISHFDYSALFRVVSNPYAPLPIARIVDTDRYDGTNPEVTMTVPIGLAEYTNANFFSEDTIFETDRYPYPNWGSVAPVAVRIQNPRDEPIDVSRRYLVKEGHGDAGYRLCTAPVLYGEVPESAEYLAPVLDENVYHDYAERLIPRAVSYSAGILKYFFRGTIEITLPPTGVYAFRRHGVSDPVTQGFDRVSVLVRNATETHEEMSGGSIDLVVTYRYLVDNPNVEDPRAHARDPFVPYTSADLPALSRPFTIVKRYDGGSEHALPSGSPVLLEFDLGDEPIPLWAVDVRLNVVYRGKLGGGPGGYPVEDDAVCVGFRDIGEPTPFIIVNDTDTVCHDDQWKRASEVDGVSEKEIMEVHVRFSPEAVPRDASPAQGEHICTFTSLAPGSYVRGYILSDTRFNESVCFLYRVIKNGETVGGTSTFGRASIRNAMEYDEGTDTVIRRYSVIDTFRNVFFWNMYYFYNPDVCTTGSCSGCDYHDNPFGLELAQ